MTPTTLDRIVGCLTGVATGDAIGKQTEMLSREDVLRWYPQGVRGFEGSPGTIVPRYVGNTKRQWLIGETTDDTERTLAVARAIVAERNVSHEAVGREDAPLHEVRATVMRSAEDAILLAANVGGDSDSVGSIAGGILGAVYPETVNQYWHDIVETINSHNLTAVATELARLRH